MTNRDRLLTEDIGEEVVVITRLKMLMQDEAGYATRVPLTYVGLLIDFDDSFILIQQEDMSVVKVSRRIVGVIDRPSELAGEVAKAMSDPNKPKPDQMS